MEYKTLTKKYDATRSIYSDMVIWLAIQYNVNQNFSDLNVWVDKGRFMIGQDECLVKSIDLKVDFTPENEEILNTKLDEISKENEEPLTLSKKYFNCIFSFYEELPKQYKTLQENIMDTINTLKDKKIYNEFMQAMKIISQEDHPLSSMNAVELMDTIYIVDTTFKLEDF